MSLKIAMFSDSALPVLNGVSVSIDMLIQGLRERDHSVHLFTAAHYGYRDPDPNTHRFPALPTPWTKGYPLAFPPFYPMLREFRRHKFDLIHTHTPFTVGFVGLRWAESHDIPIVSTYHTLYDKYAHYIPFFPRWYVRYKIAKHTNFYYQQVNHITTPSEFSKRWLMRHSVKKPITVIPTAISFNTNIDRVGIRKKLGISPESKVLLYVGRIAREKNIGMLFESVALAFRQDSSLSFWLVGDGPYREEGIRLARKLGIGDRVRFIGYVPRNEVDLYYSAADIFVFSSMTETQGLVISEAMSHGLPAVVVQGGAAALAVNDGENGFIVRNDSTIFAESVLSLVKDSNLYDRLSKGALREVKKYTTQSMIEKVQDVYSQALGEKMTMRRGKIVTY